jgi:hypothetical protein
MIDYSNVRCQGRHFIPRGRDSVLIVRCGANAELTVCGTKVCRWHVRYAKDCHAIAAEESEISKPNGESMATVSHSREQHS